MMKLEAHPTVLQYREQERMSMVSNGSKTLDAEWLRQLCLEAGADDVGFVEIARPALDGQRQIF